MRSGNNNQAPTALEPNDLIEDLLTLSEMFHAILNKTPLLDILKLRAANKESKKTIDAYLLDELKIKQITCGYEFSIILLKNGRVLGMGDNQRDQLGLGKSIKSVSLPTEIIGIDKIKQIATKGDQTC